MVFVDDEDGLIISSDTGPWPHIIRWQGATVSALVHLSDRAFSKLVKRLTRAAELGLLPVAEAAPAPAADPILCANCGQPMSTIDGRWLRYFVCGNVEGVRARPAEAAPAPTADPPLGRCNGRVDVDDLVASMASSFEPRRGGWPDEPPDPDEVIAAAQYGPREVP